jgi:hypothetical protein
MAAPALNSFGFLEMAFAIREARPHLPDSWRVGYEMRERPPQNTQIVPEHRKFEASEQKEMTASEQQKIAASAQRKFFKQLAAEECRQIKEKYKQKIQSLRVKKVKGKSQRH